MAMAKLWGGAEEKNQNKQNKQTKAVEEAASKGNQQGRATSNKQQATSKEAFAPSHRAT